jgi:hypothetical protein
LAFLHPIFILQCHKFSTHGVALKAINSIPWNQFLKKFKLCQSRKWVFGTPTSHI